MGKAGIYYFHNCPMDYLYHDSIAEGLGLDVEQVRQAAVCHLLASGMNVEQVAEGLGLDVEAVRQIEASNAQSDKLAEDE